MFVSYSTFLTVIKVLCEFVRLDVQGLSINSIFLKGVYVSAKYTTAD